MVDTPGHADFGGEVCLLLVLFIGLLLGSQELNTVEFPVYWLKWLCSVVVEGLILFWKSIMLFFLCIVFYIFISSDDNRLSGLLGWLKEQF